MHIITTNGTIMRQNGEKGKENVAKTGKRTKKTHVYCHDQVIMNELYKI